MKKIYLLGVLFFLGFHMNVLFAQKAKKINSNSKVVKTSTATKVKPKTSQMQRSISSNVNQPVARGPARDPNAPIEVVGQSRNLNMLLILQNPNEEINFVKPRTEYKKEIENMNY